MKVNYPWLQNPYFENENQRFSKREFLKTIDGILNQRQYVKITLLNWKEQAIKDIQGEIVSGTMTKTGSSAVRRTCNMSCAIGRGEYDASTMNSDFSINKKIFLEIGIKNETKQYNDYPILWFPQGVFFISSFSIASSTSSTINISLGLKDKMAMLDGSVGGRFPATVQLDTMTTQTVAGAIVEKKVKINDLIIELVNHFGGEQIPNIVVEDVPDKIRKYIRWMNSDEPLYIFKDGSTYNIQTNKDKGQGDLVRVCKYGDDVGFVYENFTYDSEFTVAANSSVTAALDTLKNYLGNFEYFYDEFGIFHFREIKNYLNTSRSTWALNEMRDYDYLMETSSMGKSVYTFSDNNNLISLTNTPQYENIRNDIIVLGTKKSTDTNLSHEVRYHVAIDKKPEINQNGYKKILVYKDPDTKRPTLTIPTIVNALPSFGKIDTIYGILNGEEEIDITGYYTKDELKTLAESSSLGSILDTREQFFLFEDNNESQQFGNDESNAKILLNRLVFLSEIYIDKQMDAGTILDVQKLDNQIKNYVQDIIHNDYYNKILNSKTNNILDKTIYSQAQLLKNICELEENAKSVKQICENILNNLKADNSEEEKDIQFAAIIKSLNRQIETCSLLIENYKQKEEDYSSQIASLSKEIQNLKMQIAWYKSRKNVQDIVDNKVSNIEYPTKIFTYKVLRSKFWYWNNEWIPVDWTRYYSDDAVYINTEYSYENLYGKNAEETICLDRFSSHNGESSYIARDWRTEIILQGLQAKYTGTDNNSYYYEELIGNWPTIYNLDIQEWENKHEDVFENYKSLCDGYFFLDIIDSSSSIYGEYCVQNIGRRQIVEVSNDTNCLFEPDTLPIGFLLEKNIVEENYEVENFETAESDLARAIQQDGLSLVRVRAEDTHITDYFSTGGIFNDAFTKIKYNLLTHTSYQNTINLSAIPAWYLEPNVIITISDGSTNTFGDYMVQSISYTFGAGNPMTVNCSKTIEKM